MLRHLHAGLHLTLDDLAWLMTIVSDNVATALLLLEVGGPDRVNAVIDGLGLRHRGSCRSTRWPPEPASASPHRATSPRPTRTSTSCAREKLFHQQDQIGLARQLSYHPLATDHGLDLPVRVFNKTGTGPGNFVDAGRFETATASWVIAVMATEQDGFTNAPDDPAPVAVGHVGKIVHDGRSREVRQGPRRRRR